MLTEVVRQAIFRRNGYRCVYCARQATLLTLGNLPIDHKIPESRGGSDALWNLQTTCATCNREKGDKTDAEYRACLSLHYLGVPTQLNVEFE